MALFYIISLILADLNMALSSLGTLKAKVVVKVIKMESLLGGEVEESFVDFRGPALP